MNIYYFSGSGNTLLVVRAVADTLKEQAVEARIHPIERTKPADIDTTGLVGFAFPVAVFSTYPFVWRFLRALPVVQGTPAFMLDTLGGESGGIVGPLRRLLEAKGYRPCGACEIIMPGNFYNVPEEDEAIPVRNAGIEKARRFAVALSNGASEWPRGAPYSSLVGSLSEAIMRLWEHPGAQQRFRVKIDSGRCVKCGACERVCPVRNVGWNNGPVLLGRCEYCLRCVACCPKDAIALFAGRRLYRASSPGELEKTFTG